MTVWTRENSMAFMPYPYVELPHATEGVLSGLTFSVKDMFDQIACASPILTAKR